MPNGRDKRRARHERNKARAPKPVCSNCGERGLHFVPPSLGEEGFYTCPRCPACGEPGKYTAHLIAESIGEPRQFSCGIAPELHFRIPPVLPKDFPDSSHNHRKLEREFFEKYINQDNPFRK